MLEFLVFIIGLGLDQLVKLWAVKVLSNMPDGIMPIIGDSFIFRYAENHGDTVSFFRSTHPVMYVFRLLQVILALYILIALRKKISKWTKAGLAMFLAGLIGNQLNYLFMGYVPDMFFAPKVVNGIFNVADLLVLVAMIILFIRLAFFEGAALIDWLLTKMGFKNDHPPKGQAAKSQIKTNLPLEDLPVEREKPDAEAAKHD